MLCLVTRSGLDIFFLVHNVPNEFLFCSTSHPTPNILDWSQQRHSRLGLNALWWYTQFPLFSHSYLSITLIFLRPRSYLCVLSQEFSQNEFNKEHYLKKFFFFCRLRIFVIVYIQISSNFLSSFCLQHAMVLSKELKHTSLNKIKEEKTTNVWEKVIKCYSCANICW